MLQDRRDADEGDAIRRTVEAPVPAHSKERAARPALSDVDTPLSDVPLAAAHAADDVHAWPDAQLVAAVRGEPLDAAALDVLVTRYWARLHARCEMLTLDRELARDIAQDTWLRVLRARATLQPESNFAGYLMTIATNLCRDRRRSARRAGPLSDARVASLDGNAAGDDELLLSNIVAEPDRLPPDEQLLLRIDLDRALAQLSERAREVLVARYVDGESAAEIGARFGRTEQTVTSWLRQAVRQLRDAFGSSGDA